MAEELIDAVKVRQEMDAMVDMITHPAFVAAMKNMKASPVSKRREIGKETLTVDALRAQGVTIPRGMRLTTRYFEPGRPGFLEVDAAGVIKAGRIPKFDVGDLGGTVQWGGCACGGGLTFCGGAGGST